MRALGETATRRAARRGVLFAYRVGSVPADSLRPYLAGNRPRDDRPDKLAQSAQQVAAEAIARHEYLAPYLLDNERPEGA